MEPSTPAGDPSEQIRVILKDLLNTIDTQIEAIHKIAERERDRLGENTPEGEAWDQFGSANQFTDVGRARGNMVLQVAAVRGCLVYRQLDSSQSDFTPLNAQAAQDKLDSNTNDG